MICTYSTLKTSQVLAMPQQLPLINMLLISCKKKKILNSNTPADRPRKKSACFLFTRMEDKKAAFANADVHLSTNKCRVSRNLDSRGRKSLAASW